MTPLKPGATLSHYRILEQLGQGGQATAYKAEDTRLNRTVVIKTLLPDLATSQNARRRFEREARLASALDHPNICAIYDIGENDGLCYIVMPFIPGRTLKEVVSGQSLEILSALSIAIQIADAIAAAHARGIVHRDIKPTNVIVNDQGQVKVLDFGLAKMLAGEESELPGHDAEKSMTEIGVPYGTLGYGSPEQATGERVDHRTDIFSLGVVLYEMITGRQPFRGNNRIEVLHAVTSEEADPLVEFNAQTPGELQAILDRAMAKKPRSRFESMTDLRDALKNVMRAASSETGIVPTEVSATLVPPQRSRNSWRLTGALGRVFGKIRGGQAPTRSLAPSDPLASQNPADRSSSGGSASPSRPPTWGSETKQTIAVLPFKNLSGNAEDNFYEFSLADGIITELAPLRQLVVRPSQYIAQFTGQSVDPRQVGEALAVNNVLTGNFIKTPDRFRVTTQLITTDTGAILWSEKIDINARDLITIQDTIVERVIAGLKLKLTEEEQEKIEKPLTTNPEAYEFYLRGRDVLFQYISHSFDDRDLEMAVKMFQEAIRLDPFFARAHYALGRCYVHYGQGYGGHHYFHLAEEALQRALEINPDIPGAHLQMVYVYLHRGDKDKALATLANVRREAPSDPTVFIIAGMLYRLNGLYDKAFKQYDRLLELNPRDIVIASYNRGRLYTYRHEYDKAIVEFEKARAVEPEHPLVKTFLALTYFNADRIDECQKLLEEVLRDHPHFDAVQVLLAWCCSRRERHEQARALITERVKEVAAADHDVSVWLASFYAMENMRDEAIDWIKQAIRLGNENYPLYADNSRLDNLRCDLRFVDLMNELKQHWEERRK
ncbi:MAG: protein kinase [Blastocatellia bacterium]|nr:protein kinase [Blastocatellia bacterium]